MVPIGYLKKYTFSIEKKEFHFLDIVTKDQRKLKFKFDGPNSYYRMNDALSRLIEITKQKDLFAFDFSVKIKETNFSDDSHNLFMNEAKSIDIAMNDFKRMGVTSPEGLKLF
jgi:hypothetical protein